MNKKALSVLITLGWLALLASACSAATPIAPSEPEPTATTAAPTPKPTDTRIALTRPSAAPYLLTYDPDIKQIILISNLSSNTDVWAYDVAGQKLTRVQDKPPISVQCQDHHPNAKGVITYAKTSGATYFFNPLKNEWSELAPGRTDEYITPGYQCFLRYDSAIDKMVTLVAGPFTGFHDYATNTWTFTQQDPSPSLNAGPMAYDSESDRILKWEAITEKKMWAYDGNSETWEKVTYTGGPSEGSWMASMVYVPDLDRTFLYLFDEFFAYDYNTNTWEPAKGELKPPGRYVTSMTYDPVAKKIVLYGGYNETGTISYDDLWLYDPQTGEWTAAHRRTVPSEPAVAKTS